MMSDLSKFSAYSFLLRSTIDCYNRSVVRKNSLSCYNRKVSKKNLEELKSLEDEIEFYSFVIDLLDDFRFKGFFMIRR